MKFGLIVAAAGVLILGAAFASGSAPMDERQAIALLQSRCAMCHSTDLIGQQRLNRDRWTATLHKMRTWGAPISDTEQTIVLEYLQSRFHPSAPPGLSLESESQSTPTSPQ